jgi:Zn-dependent M28 family amino/carboxypeptidase
MPRTPFTSGRAIGAGLALASLATLSLTACAGDKAPTSTVDLGPALASITADDLLRHIGALADDSTEGRAPGTPGEDKTVAYLESQFRAMGLAPGNPDGSYVQAVTLTGFRGQTEASFRVGGRTIPLTLPNDYVAVSRHDRPEISVESDLVFVGYGVVAPEYGWDDYKGIDVTGKTVVMLINDPAVPDPADSTRLDPNMFKGDAMTYYGRWTYKYEIASAKGAAAAIIVHETGPAGYPWEVVSGSWGRENFDIARPGGDPSRVRVESWISLPTAQALFAAAGQDFAALKAAATRKDFTPVALGGTARFRVRNSTRTVQSRNVIAKLEGSDPAQRDEYVVYTAHWDHLGRDTTRTGDQIFNGALDNASGTAVLLEIAQAYATLGQRPPRTVLFLAVTAEEYGLLGAKYFAENPLVPLDRVLANINMDGINQWGRTSDLTVVGYGNSTLEDILAELIAPDGRRLSPDPEPAKGFFFRSDHFEFSKKGVPALYLNSGTDFIGKPAGYGQQKRDEYMERDYHKVTDEIKPDWDLAGAVEDTRALFQVGHRVLTGSTWPTWKPGTEFKAVRDSSLAVRR